MGMHRDLWMRKVLQATILSAEFIIIPTNNKFTKAVRYINHNKSLERYYVLINIIFPCLRVIHLVDSNLAGMKKVYYYSRMTNQRINKTGYYIDYQELFPDINSTTNIWDMYYNERYEEDS